MSADHALPSLDLPSGCYPHCIAKSAGDQGVCQQIASQVPAGEQLVFHARVISAAKGRLDHILSVSGIRVPLVE